MNKILLLITALLSLTLQSFSQVTPTWAWGEDYSGTVVSSIYHNDYVYVIGNYSNNPLQIESILLSNAGGDDMYLAKWDTVGNLIWAKSISDTGSQTAVDIHVSSNNEIVVAGNNTSPNLVIGNDTITSGTNNGAFIAKYDLNGNVLNAFGISSSGINSFCLDIADNLYATTIDGLFKYSNFNSLDWQKPIYASQILYSSTGSCLMILGEFVGNLTLGGTTITSAYSVVWGPNPDNYCAKADLNGNVTWLINLTNTIHPDFISKAYLQNSSGDIFLSINSVWPSAWYLSLSEISNNGMINNLPFQNTIPGVIITPIYASNFPSMWGISGKDSFVSFMLRSTMYGPYEFGVFNLNTQKTEMVFDCISSHHLFNGPNSIYMKGYTNGIAHTFGKLGAIALTSPNTHLVNHNCIGSTVNLSSNVIGGVPPLTYSWAPSIGLSSTSNDTTSFVASSNISYTLTVTDANSQVVKDTFDIIVDTPLTSLVITPQFPAFCHDSMYLNSNLGVNAIWNKNYGVSWTLNYPLYNNSQTIIYGPGLYKASSTNSCGTVSDTIQIQSVVNVIANTSLTDICVGQSVTLSGSGAQLYSWTSGVINNISFNPTTTTTYTVTGTDSSGCVDTTSIQIMVHPTPTISTITATPAIICTGASSILSLNQSISYCSPTVSFSGTLGDYIANVNFGSGLINNTTGDGPGDYNYYTTLNANVIAGAIYPISISTYSWSTNFRSVWIDFNQDGIFNDFNEKVFAKDTSAVTVSGNITIPMTAFNGKTRMRIAGKWLGGATPCYIDNYGEFEDYNITISGGVDNIQWSPSTFLSTTNEVQVQATNVSSTTTYTATVTSAYGCSNSGTVTLTVNPSSASITDVTICSTSLPYVWNAQSLTSSGTYTSNFTNSIGCDSVATLNLTVNSTSASATNTTICSTLLPFVWNSQLLTSSGIYSSTFTNALGCDSIATLNLIVNPSSASTTNVTICSTTLPYVWNAQSLTASGVYTSTFTNALGCDSIATLNLTVNPIPIVTIIPGSDSTICFGASYMLEVGNSFASYAWSLNSSSISSVNTVAITDSGTYIVSCVDSNGCIGYDSVHIYMTPIPDPLIVQSNDTLKCTNANNMSYLWHFNGANIGTDSTLIITQNGVYYVKVTDSIGCIGFDTLVVIGLGMNDISSSGGILIYPNPTSDFITIECNLKETAPLDLKLLDAQGRIVWNKKYEEKTPGIYIEQINLKSLGLKPGVYLLTGRTLSNQWTKRIVYLDK